MFLVLISAGDGLVFPAEYFYWLPNKEKLKYFWKYEEVYINIDKFIIVFLSGKITGECSWIVRWESDNLFRGNGRGK